MDSCHEIAPLDWRRTLDAALPARSPLTATALRAILSFSPTYIKPGTLKLQNLTEFHSVSGAHLCPQENPCMCARPPPPFFPSQFQRIYHFLCYICSKVSIWCTGLDLVASNKLLFQCCLCSGPHRRQLCGWPPWSPQGQPYIWLMWVTDHSWRCSPTHGDKVVCQLLCFQFFLVYI